MACNKHEGDGKFMQKILVENLKVRDHLGTLGIDKRITLIYIY
jgi:hypothetical protein